MGFNFIVTASLLWSQCGFFFVFGPGVSFFGGFQHPLVDGCSATGCDFGVLVEGHEHTSLYSAILNWKPLLLFILFFYYKSADVWQGIERTLVFFLLSINVKHNHCGN